MTALGDRGGSHPDDYTAREDWRWTTLLLALAAATYGTFGYLGWQEFLEYGTCYDIQGDVDTQLACDRLALAIDRGRWMAVAATAASAVLMLPIGMWRGAVGRPATAVVPGLGFLAVASPSGLLGYLVGWTAGSSLRQASRRSAAGVTGQAGTGAGTRRRRPPMSR